MNQKFIFDDELSSKKYKKCSKTLVVSREQVLRVPIIHKQHKGYQDSFSMEIHKLENKNRGLYIVDGLLHPRKDLQLVKGNVIICSFSNSF